jgi:hypothetical protein
LLASRTIVREHYKRANYVGELYHIFDLSHSRQ